MSSPTSRDPYVQVAQAYQRTERSGRYPQHPFSIKSLPFQIQPIAFAPVLPGETLKSVMLQAQAWTDPLKPALKNTGWWCEYNIWYIKHRDMLRIADSGIEMDKALIDMIVSNGSMAAHQDADGFTKMYCPPGGVDYCFHALLRVVDEYYRDEGEEALQFHVDFVPLAKIYGRGRSDAMEKLTLVSNYDDDRVDMIAGGHLYVGDQVNHAYQEWAVAHDAGVTDMDYDDWMRTYGGASNAPDPERIQLHIPEDIAFMRTFQMPTNTVEPTTGVPAVAVGWRTGKQVRKSVRFDEPGWIMVTQCCRPKVFLQNQEGMFADMMQTRDSWMPAVLNADTTIGHQLIDDATGPLKTVLTEDYYWHVRDLLLYGEQFLNYAPTADAGFVSLPSADSGRRYATAANIHELFVDETNGVIRTDGMISLNILGRQKETTRNLVMHRT